MISLQNDYSEGAHPRILTLLSETNRVQSTGYGEDAYCLQAASYNTHTQSVISLMSA